MSNPHNLDRLTEDDLSCFDNDDFMKKIYDLITQKENLQNDINKKVMELSTWRDVLQTSTMEEARELIDMLPETSMLSQEETELLQEFRDLSNKATAYSANDFCSSCMTEEGDMLLEFSSPFISYSSTKYAIWLKAPANSEYEIKYHNLPGTIPVAVLLDKYLKYGKDSCLKRFCTVIKQLLWPIFYREDQALKYQKSDTLAQDNYVYRTEDCTLMSFTLPINETDVYEFVLKYQINDILPYEVKTSAITCEGPQSEHQRNVRELAEEMKERPFAEVIISYAEASSLKTSTDGSRSSENSSDTVLFEMFR